MEKFIKTNNIYIGSTCKLRLCDRMSKHRADVKRNKTGKHGYVSSSEIIKYGDLICNLPISLQSI